MRGVKGLCLLVAVCLLPALSYGAGYYEGKAVTIVVGYKPGGGYDSYARLLAKHLPKYLPGNPTVVIQNMPGANSIIGANHLYGVGFVLAVPPSSSYISGWPVKRAGS